MDVAVARDARKALSILIRQAWGAGRRCRLRCVEGISHFSEPFCLLLLQFRRDAFHWEHSKNVFGQSGQEG